MAIIGLRDIVPSIDFFPVKKVFCKFDISGDTKEAVVTNKHAVIGGASNMLEVVSVEIDVPLDVDYSPVLTVYAYDHVMGFLGTRLLGVANIPLEKYCRKVLASLKQSTSAFKHEETVHLDQITIKGKMLKMAKHHEDHKADANKELFEESKASGPLDFDLKSAISQPKAQRVDHHEHEKNAKDQKKRAMVEEHKKKVKEEEAKREEEETKKAIEKAQQKALIKKRSSLKPQKAKFMKFQEDYDSQPEEELDEIPEWLKDRGTYEGELEEDLGHPPFDIWKIMRGQTRGKANYFAKTVQNTLEKTALFKDIIKIKDKSMQSTEVDKQFQEFITPKK